MDIYSYIRQSLERWVYYQQFQPFGPLYFYLALVSWVKHYPTVARCANCGSKIWINGKQDCFVFCNEYCAMYGPYVAGDEFLDDDFPF